MENFEVIKGAILRDRNDAQAYWDAFYVIRDEGLGIEEGHELQRLLRAGPDAEWVYELSRKVLCYCAPLNFDDFLLYMEIDRPWEKSFYPPRRKQLKPLVDAMQRLEDRKITMLALSLPPGVGKSTLAFLYCTFTGGRHPEKPILMGSHSNSFLEGAYDEIDRMLDPEGEYKWHEIFPDLKVIGKDAKRMMIDIGRDKKDEKRFMTYEFGSVGSKLAGKVRAENLLYCDDLVDTLETAMSKERLDKLYDGYVTDYRQRKIGSCAELHIATRWSLYDVIGRLEEKYGNNPKAEFISVPALNENDESNFDYPIDAGFTTEFYHEQRDIMDDALWQALFMNQPIEREGQLYKSDELRRYFTLPDREPDAIIAVCDTKDKGPDDCVMPIAYVYGDDYYIEDVVCDDGNPKVVDKRLGMKLMKHNVQIARFESNAAGGKTAENVARDIKEQKGITSIQTRWSQQAKDTKILVNSPWVLDHCLFKDNSIIKDKEYRNFIRKLCTYTLKGRNLHDDVPDAMAQLALFAQSLNANVTKVIKSPFSY